MVLLRQGRYILNNINKIIEIGKTCGGYVIGKAIAARGISTVYLSRMLKSGALTRLAPGIYLLNGYPEDEFYTVSLRYAEAVFSHRTAMYLNELTNRQCEYIEVNFPINYNNAHIEKVKFYRMRKEILDLGKITVKTPLGHEVKSYNIERCICDLFYYDDFDIEDKSYAIKVVDKSKIDYDKLFSYAKIMQVLPQVKSIFEVI